MYKAKFMDCTKCGGKTQVIDSRAVTRYGFIRRRRACLECSFRISTYEVPVEEYEEILNLRKIKDKFHQVKSKFFEMVVVEPEKKDVTDKKYKKTPKRK